MRARSTSRAGTAAERQRVVALTADGTGRVTSAPGGIGVDGGERILSPPSTPSFDAKDTISHI
jgi:hypothetical protein